MKIGLSGDWHLGIARYSHNINSIPSKTLDSVTGIRHQIRICKEQNCDVFVVAGDIFHTTNPKPVFVKMAADLLNEACAYFPTVLVICGNHDPKPLLSSSVGPVGLLQEMVRETVKCYEGKNDIYRHMDVDFILCPYIDSSNTLKFDLDSKKKKIVIAHTTFDKCKSGSEATMIAGGVKEIGSIPGANLVLTGHIHTPQSLTLVDGVTVLYSGSPAKFDFGERNDAKGVWIIDDCDLSHEFITIPIRKMVQIEIDDEELNLSDIEVINILKERGLEEGCEVKVVLKIKPNTGADLAKLKRLVATFNPHFAVEPKVVKKTGIVEDKKVLNVNKDDKYLIKQRYVNEWIVAAVKDEKTRERVKQLAYEIIGDCK